MQQLQQLRISVGRVDTVEDIRHYHYRQAEIRSFWYSDMACSRDAGRAKAIDPPARLVLDVAARWPVLRVSGLPHIGP